MCRSKIKCGGIFPVHFKVLPIRAGRKQNVQNNGRERAEEPQGLIHSDVCGKISSPSFVCVEYSVIFIDSNTYYVWVCVVKHKNEVFQKFTEWKSLVEKSSCHNVKQL